MAVKVVIAKTQDVSNFTANALQVVSIAKIAIAMDAAIILKTRAFARKPSPSFWKEIPTHSGPR